MTKMKVQEFLEKNSLKDLKQTYGIDYSINTVCRRDSARILLCYNQIESKPSEIVDECRGLILQAKEFSSEKSILGETFIVCRPFKRFYNYGQPGAATVDFAKSKFFEKLDGSLIKYYFCYSCEDWHFATKKTFVADQQINPDCELSFSDVVFDALDLDNSNLSPADKQYTYLFELVGPENKVVVDYAMNDIFLLGAIKNETGEEMKFSELSNLSSQMKIKTPSFWTFDTVEEANKYLLAKKGSEFEGFVVVDDNFNRVKIKHPDYSLLNKLKDKASSSSKNLLELILKESDDDAATTLPKHLVKKLNSIKNSLIEFSKKIDGFYVENKKLSRKDFAITVNQNELPIGPLMWLYSKKGKSFIDWAKETGLKSDSALKLIVEMIGWKIKNDDSEDIDS